MHSHFRCWKQASLISSIRACPFVPVIIRQHLAVRLSSFQPVWEWYFTHQHQSTGWEDMHRQYCFGFEIRTTDCQQNHLPIGVHNGRAKCLLWHEYRAGFLPQLGCTACSITLEMRDWAVLKRFKPSSEALPVLNSKRQIYPFERSPRKRTIWDNIPVRFKKKKAKPIKSVVKS